jgi:hypothetical protein
VTFIPQGARATGLLGGVIGSFDVSPVLDVIAMVRLAGGILKRGVDWKY